MTDVEKANAIYSKYKFHYNGEVQGTCSVIVRDIICAIGGEAVAGFIDYRWGERSHWWVEKDGITYDPMTDDKFYPDEYKHKEVHRDQTEFTKVLQNYLQYAI